MRNIFISIALIFINTGFAFSQNICDSIEFYSDTIYVNQSTDDSIRIRFDFDWTMSAGVEYPSYSISLNDTSNIIFHQIFVGTFLGQQDSIDFEINYKNPNIPLSYSVIGSFDIFDPNNSPTLICQFPLIIIFNTPVLVEKNENKTEFKISSNPFKNSFIFQCNNVNIKEFYIIDLFGNLLIDLPPIRNQKINMDNFNNGTYVLVAKDNSGQIIIAEKLIKCQ